ncbi:hypothetical protein H5410_020348 [Solanum commersonii]|uniref:Uncharacterized protein n=1 Tax=Solanum commersonii TaxID=4109 RepID=A0A9J5Z7R7_SOLCO|nr:hypothetical protein H5410_020348 [Solanum commersonii]
MYALRRHSEEDTQEFVWKCLSEFVPVQKYISIGHHKQSLPLRRALKKDKNSHFFPDEKNKPEENQNSQDSVHNMNSLRSFVTLSTLPITLGDQTFYATHTSNPNQTPHSWLEMSMQEKGLSFGAEVEGRAVIILVQNPTFLAKVRGYEASNEDVEQPPMVVNCYPPSTKFSLPSDSLQSSPFLGNAILQPIQCFASCGPSDLSTLLLPSSDFGDPKITGEPMEFPIDSTDLPYRQRQ